MESFKTECESWADFEQAVRRLHHDYKEHYRRSIILRSEPLFRGHADDSWELETTLEREGEAGWSESKYIQAVGAAYRYLGGFNSNLPRFTEPALHFDDTEHQGTFLENYSLLAYLRHHGFPSPLLDWTASPFVAAFFAFNPRPGPSVKRVAIYSLEEHLGEGKEGSAGTPFIRTYGPFTEGHARHHLQQCQYSVCFRQAHGSRIEFCSHQEILKFSEKRPKQDRLLKFTLPISVREEALENLRLMNITPYSVFQSEDALVETAAHRVFRDERWKKSGFPEHFRGKGKNTAGDEHGS